MQESKGTAGEVIAIMCNVCITAVRASRFVGHMADVQGRLFTVLESIVVNSWDLRVLGVKHAIDVTILVIE
jgi:translation initiation factor 2 gamma subunit (eIF-2gamma)